MNVSGFDLPDRAIVPRIWTDLVETDVLDSLVDILDDVVNQKTKNRMAWGRGKAELLKWHRVVQEPNLVRWADLALTLFLFLS